MPKLTTAERRKLRHLIVTFADAEVAASWAGSQDPGAAAEIRDDAKTASAALEDYLRRL